MNKMDVEIDGQDVTPLLFVTQMAGTAMHEFRPGQKPSETETTNFVKMLRLADSAGAMDALLESGEAWGRDNDKAPATITDLLASTRAYPAQHEALLDVLRESPEYGDVVRQWEEEEDKVCRAP
jgi:hypothetical protein